MKIDSKHNTKSDALNRLAMLEKRQANKPEHKRNHYTIDHDFLTGEFVVLNWGN